MQGASPLSPRRPRYSHEMGPSSQGEVLSLSSPLASPNSTNASPNGFHTHNSNFIHFTEDRTDKRRPDAFSEPFGEYVGVEGEVIFGGEEEEDLAYEYGHECGGEGNAMEPWAQEQQEQQEEDSQLHGSDFRRRSSYLDPTVASEMHKREKMDKTKTKAQGGQERRRPKRGKPKVRKTRVTTHVSQKTSSASEAESDFGSDSHDLQDASLLYFESSSTPSASQIQHDTDQDVSEIFYVKPLL